MTEKRKSRWIIKLVANEIVIEPDSDEYRRMEKSRLDVVAKNIKEHEELLVRMRSLGVTLNSIENARTLSPRDFRSFAAAAKEEMSKLAMPGVRAALACALDDAKARALGAGGLLQEFVKSHDSCTHSEEAVYIGAAIVRMARQDELDAVLRLAQSSRFGTDRIMMIRGLSSVRDDRVDDLLIQSLGDRTVRAHAAYALGRRRCTRAILGIRHLIENGDTYERGLAKAALKRIVGSRLA